MSNATESSAATSAPIAATAKKKAPPSASEPTSVADMVARLQAMKAAQRKRPVPTYDERVASLDALAKVVLKYKDEIVAAVKSDFGNRSRHESLLAEVFVTHGAIKHARDHVREWMDVEPREVAWTFLPGRAEVVIQPLGVVGIIAPWNYPVQLALSPLVAVLAAGNRALIKPSELTPATSDLLVKMMAEAFAPDQVGVVSGGAAVGEAFSKLPFDHLVFTGSTKVGKLVMRAASENLVPVTLELGGKSPAIVDDDFSIDQAALEIMTGKCFNSGQTCIAPDYVLLPKGKADRFVEACRTAVAKMYPNLPTNADYTTVVNDGHFNRLRGLVDDARAKGAKVVDLNPSKDDPDPKTRKMAPVLVLDPTEDLGVMQDEIFGPILPVMTYTSLDEAIDYVNDHPRPLALYFFSHDQAKIDRMLEDTTSGGVSINTTMLHCAQDDLPFGGVGPSGMGHYHAREGFDAFSKKKAVFYQSRLNAAGLLRAPYGKAMDTLLRVLLGK
jgi:acyl-CoA reductase-like NAD-dependent aldehyde dehydrogenase